MSGEILSAIAAGAASLATVINTIHLLYLGRRIRHLERGTK